jgi:hypothetical protein
MAIDTTVGGANANSWASVAEFKAYRDVRVPANATVNVASDATIEAALQATCRSINADFEWTGAAVDNVQALTWPRSGMLSRNGFAIATTVNPKELKDAQSEFAFQLIAGGNFADDDAAAKANVLGVKAGSVSVQFQQTFSNTTEAVDLAQRKLTSEFAYLYAVPGEVRRILVPSWYNENTAQRPVMFAAM